MGYRINISDIMTDKSYPDAGASLYVILTQNLDEDRIVLDMKGITIVPSLFLNTSIGRLINEKGVSLVKQKIAFCNIPKSQLAFIREYVRLYSA